MKAPWRGKTGLAKLTAVFATTLGIATGLCGLNYVSVMLVIVGGAPLQPNGFWARARGWTSVALVYAAYLEVVVMVVSVLALFLIGVILIVKQLVLRADDEDRS